jgi:hypothetical protein
MPTRLNEKSAWYGPSQLRHTEGQGGDTRS